MIEIHLPSELLAANDIDPRWNQGPFADLKRLPAKAKGKRFEQIAQRVFESRGHAVGRPLNKDHDRLVDSHKYEIKGSTITKGSNDCFSFLQIRPSQDYNYLVLETFWFDGLIKYHKLDKTQINGLIAAGTFVPQHGGRKGNSGTFSYNGNLKPFDPYFWFEIRAR